MITVEEAKAIVAALPYTLKTEKQSLNKALNRVLAENVFSPISMPPFEQSAVDGYALKLGASLHYKVIAEVQAGSALNPLMKAGEAVRIFTGAAVPTEADAVIMQEKTLVKEGGIIIEEQPKLMSNIRPLGEQILKGELALEQGTILTPAAIGFLAGLGLDKVTVYCKPIISVLVTGNELVTVGLPLERGQIYESNGIMLETAIIKDGFEVNDILQVPDNYEQTKAVLKEQLANNDFLVITGGISVGDYDYVGKALLELGVEQLFYKVRQKPGKPMFLGRKDNCTVFALPGNPGAALTCYYQYVLKALRQAMGEKNFELKKVYLPLLESYPKEGIRAHFLKALLTPNGVQILNKQSSAMLHSFSYAEVFVYIPADKMVTEIGELVEVHLLP